MLGKTSEAARSSCHRDGFRPRRRCARFRPASSTAIMSSLARIAEKRDLARLTRHGELVVLRRMPTLRIGKANVSCRRLRFCRRRAEGEAVLARLVLSCCGRRKRAADLFAGIGPFALRLAERMRVHAIDYDGLALAALQRAAASTERTKASDSRAAGSFPAAAYGHGVPALRCRSVRSAATGRRGAIAARLLERACRESSRCPAIRRHLRATRAFWCEADTG